MEYGAIGKLDEKLFQATDIADQYRSSHGVELKRVNDIGFTCIPVLAFLNGKPWDNMALNYVHALRPNYIRVVEHHGGITADAYSWRVTVWLQPDNRTIGRIEQEVEVGLIGCRFGDDLIDDRPGARRPPDPLNKSVVMVAYVPDKL